MAAAGNHLLVPSWTLGNEVSGTDADMWLQVVLPVLKDIEAKHSKAGMGAVSSAITTVTLEYVAAMCSTLIQVKNFDIEDWETVSPQPFPQLPALFCAK